MSWYFCLISEAEPRSSFFTDTTLADVGGGFAGGRPIGQQQLMLVRSSGESRRKVVLRDEKTTRCESSPPDLAVNCEIRGRNRVG